VKLCGVHGVRVVLDSFSILKRIVMGETLGGFAMDYFDGSFSILKRIVMGETSGT